MKDDRCTCALCESYARIEGQVIPVHKGPKRGEPSESASGLYRYIPSVDGKGWDLVIPTRSYRRDPLGGFAGPSQGGHRE